MVTYVLAGGCFWCLDAVFRELRGVSESLCGYTGGAVTDADYYSVVSGETDHVEAVQVTFDESVLPGDALLDIFFSIHNPTTLNRQGADVGPQYRSAMFYSDDQQKEEFESAINRVAITYPDPIVTVLSPLDAFYIAEPEHQNYYTNNSNAGYCKAVISPKISKTHRNFAQFLKS